MAFKYIKITPLIFIFTWLLLSIIFFFISYKFLIKDFLELETTQNKNNTNTLLNAMNSEIVNIKNITNDYSKWDDSYTFIENENHDYVYQNFREGTRTLEDLNIDFMLYVNNNQKIIFSKYVHKVFDKNEDDFEKNILKKFKINRASSTIFKYKSHLMYLIKSAILKSDETGEVRGYIYTGKIINNSRLNELTEVFKKIELFDKSSLSEDSQISLASLKNVKVHMTRKSQYITNNIQFFDNNQNYIFSIITKNDMNIVSKGEKTILIFGLVVSLFLFLFLYILYRNQTIIERYSEMLESKVSRRTVQLSKTLHKLKTRNKELYTIANVDALTKIKNRRSYFISSEIALEKSKMNDTDLSILIMDIDYFKKINDTYGHAVGDKVLIEFCNIVNSIIDEKAIFGRIGGEEFCITFINTAIDDAMKIAEEIRVGCEKSELSIEGHKVSFTISLGISPKEDLKTIDEILLLSDEFLYKAKESGRNRLVRTS